MGAIASGRLIAGLAAVLLAAVLFTNAVEWAGRRAGLTQGALGSIFAAVGTALPEAIVAILAVVLGARHAEGADLGVGAIIGAPLLLATVAFWVTGLAALLLARRHVVMVQREALEQDLRFFLLVYTLAVLAGLVPVHVLKLAVAVALVVAYGIYARRVLGGRPEVEEGDGLRPLICTPHAWEPRWRAILLQVALALIGMFAGASLFVAGLSGLASRFGISAFVLSVIVTPLATELPETMNSVIWMRQGKDTLAMANITGAMALQSSLIPALGIVATPWALGRDQILAAGLTLVSTMVVYISYRLRGRLSALQLVASGVFYVVFIFLVL